MKQRRFYLKDKDYDEVVDMAESSGSSFSVFVRQAVLEKMDRERALATLFKAKDELSSLIEEMRLELGRTRRDLVEDNQVGLEKIQADVNKSLRKNEEMQKTFILLLGKQVSSQPANPRPRRNDDGPMPIPG